MEDPKPGHAMFLGKTNNNNSNNNNNNKNNIIIIISVNVRKEIKEKEKK